MEVGVYYFLEDDEKLLFVNLSVAVLIDCTQELLNIVVSHITRSSHIFEGIVDDAFYLLVVQCAAIVNIIFLEDGVDC